VSTVFSLAGPDHYGDFAMPPGMRWICLQHGMDVFISNPLNSMIRADAIMVMSPFWIDYALQLYRAKNPVEEASEAAFRAKCHVVGFPEADSFKSLEASALRAKFGVPPEKKVLLYLPWDKNVDFGPWAEVFSFPFRPHRILSRLLRNPSFLPYFFRGWHEYSIFKAIKAFCDREGVLLIVKSRKKAMDGGFIRNGAHSYFLDLSDYPPTIVELIRISSLCVHYHSFATQELGAAGVPALCVHLDPFHAKERGFGPFTSLMADKARNFFHWEGFSKVLTPPELFKLLKRASFPEIAGTGSPGAESYQDRYLGLTDGLSSSRLLDALEKIPNATAVSAAAVDDVRP